MRALFLVTIASGRRPWEPAKEAGSAQASRELLADELAYRRPVRAAGDLRHHVGHHAAEVAHARRTALGDRVVDDRLELLFRSGSGMNSSITSSSRSSPSARSSLPPLRNASAASSVSSALAEAPGAPPDR